MMPSLQGVDHKEQMTSRHDMTDDWRMSAERKKYLCTPPVPEVLESGLHGIENKRKRIFSPQGTVLLNEQVEVQMDLAEMKSQRSDSSSDDGSPGPFYGEIGVTSSQSGNFKSDDYDGEETIEAMLGHIEYKDYRDPRNLPSNSTSSIFASETISSPNTDQIILCMAAVLQVQMIQDEENTNGEQNPSCTIFDVDFETDVENSACAADATVEERIASGSIPSIDYIYQFLSGIYRAARYSPECHIIALVYINRVISGADVRLTSKNWRVIALTSLILAQKVWDDKSLKTSVFCTITPFTKTNLKEFELRFLSLLNFKATVKISLYAQYYFELRSLFERLVGLRAGTGQFFPIRPLSIAKAKHLQVRSELFTLQPRRKHRSHKVREETCKTLEDITIADNTRYVLS